MLYDLNKKSILFFAHLHSFLFYWVHLLPLAVPDSLDVDRLVALSVGKSEDENPVPQSIGPRAVHDVPIRVLVLA